MTGAWRPIDGASIEGKLRHLARKYGGANLVWGTAIALSQGEPADYGVAVGRHVPVRRAVALALSMASRNGGRRRLRALIDKGELEMGTELACEADDSMHPLTGPVDILGVQESQGVVRAWVTSHLRCLASFDTVEEARHFVVSRNLELDRVLVRRVDE